MRKRVEELEERLREFEAPVFDEEGNEVDAGGSPGTVAHEHHAALLDAAAPAPDRAHDLVG